MLGQQLYQPSVVGKDIYWPGFDFSEDSFVKVFNLERDSCMLANTLTLRNPLWACG